LFHPGGGGSDDNVGAVDDVWGRKDGGLAAAANELKDVMGEPDDCGHPIGESREVMVLSVLTKAWEHDGSVRLLLFGDIP
jgi:hypothetical protein